MELARRKVGLLKAKAMNEVDAETLGATAQRRHRLDMQLAMTHSDLELIIFCVYVSTFFVKQSMQYSTNS
jgi:hypothetical protein